MKIQRDWLQQYVDCPLPTEELGHTLTMAGLEIEAHETVSLPDGESTEVLELNVTPNRGYCLSHIGVAREVAALTDSALTLPHPEETLRDAPTGPGIGERLSVGLEAADLCPRYAALVIENVNVAPSPKWLADRLTAIGLRPINNVVDITNFVLMEYGQPLHAFDLDRLADRRIVIRRAKEKEAFEALDGTKLELEPDALVIADNEKPVALAGVMGGANSQVTETTLNIALESACFDPSSVRKTSKQYGLRSDSSYRFERGVDIEAVITAQARAAQLILELAGGTLAEGRIDQYPTPRGGSTTRFRVERCNAVLGTRLSADEIKHYLTALGMGIVDGGNGEFEITVPAFRPMLEREIDLIEEVARLHGYDKIEITAPVGALASTQFTPVQTLVRQCRETLTGLGYAEVVNYSFLEQENAEPFLTAFGGENAATIALDNPISLDLGTMRTSLIPGLVKTAVRNIHHGQKSLRLFEQGTAFFREGESITERACLAVVVTGLYPPDIWHAAGKGYDFFDLKGTFETLMARFGVTADARSASRPWFSTSPAVDYFSGDRRIASLGELAAETARRMDLEQALFALEIDLEALAAALPETVRFQPLPRFPGSYRDISLLVDQKIPAGDIAATIRSAGQPLLQQVELYDHFEGKKLEPGKKSLTYALMFQSPEKTLTDEEVNPVFESIVRTLAEKVDARLRD
ncbi:MAG: phenylalanine--tRNA ligase subunit beta [Nitrospina sp.]|nr:phenylalanine--tRNA ligase subunit beta [Nitrospina sp.]